jgi:hypothetical protein
MLTQPETAMRALIAALALTLVACSAEPDSSAVEATTGATAAAAEPAPGERTGRLVDPSAMQVAALVGDWTGEPVDVVAAAERQPEYLNAAAADRDTVRSRLVEAERTRFEAAQDVGVLEVTTPINNATYEADKGVYHLPVFLPGSTIALAPGHRLRLTNAAAAYTLASDTTAAQAMTRANARPARVRLIAHIEQVRPTAAGSEIVGRLESFTLYDADGVSLGEPVSMRGAG